MISLLKFLLLARSAEVGVVETPVDGLNYIPGIYNDHIGLQNVLVKTDKLILRSTIDDSSMIRWEIPNTADNWSFSFDFNELNLESRESAGLYLFYTQDKQTLGNFKGGTSKYHGFMTGIEMSGKAVELTYAKNSGLDYRNISEYVTKVDSLNPSRFVDVTSLKMKVICTKQNFKVEVYDGDRLLYDNFRFFDQEELNNHKKGYFLSLFAEYRHVSSGKAFELKNAILSQREEKAEYSVSKIRMDKIVPQLKSKNDILHPNTEVSELIFKIGALSNYTKSVLGDLPETSITKSEKELVKEIDTLTVKLDKLASLTSNKKQTKNFISNLNNLDLKLKGLEKKLVEIDFLVEQINEKQNKRFSIFETVAISASCFIVLVLSIKEFQSFFDKRKLTKN
jgi:hypothetical protein